MIVKTKHKTYEMICKQYRLCDSLKIDSKSYKQNTYLTFNEIKTIFKYSDIKLFEDDVLIFDSKKDDFNNLDFNLVQKIYDEIKNEISLSQQETKQFLELCENYLNANTSEVNLPEELFIAKHIFSKNLSLTYTEMMNMETKKYEKILLALNLIKQAVGESND